MATPLVAGLATLLRQYLMKGYHPSGPHTPSSALMKALLIHSAEPLGGFVQYPPQSGLTVEDLSKAPNPFQGHGLVHLDGILWDPKGSLFFFDSPQEILFPTGADLAYCFTGNNVADFMATLVYTDVPGQAMSFLNLVNNLGLSIYYPNNDSPVNLDDNDNVKKHVMGGRGTSGEFAVVVSSENIVTAQRFALVVSGSVSPSACTSKLLTCWLFVGCVPHCLVCSCCLVIVFVFLSLLFRRGLHQLSENYLGRCGQGCLHHHGSNSGVHLRDHWGLLRMEKTPTPRPQANGGRSIRQGERCPFILFFVSRGNLFPGLGRMLR